MDVSPVYLFYIEETDSVEFNRKNVISTTNWLVNVDKRLTLKQAMPHIDYLQNKRKKAGIHKNAAARNYFSCSNPDIQNLSFIDFTEVNYSIKGKSETDSDTTTWRVVVENPNTIQIISPENKVAKTHMTDLVDSIKTSFASHQDKKQELSFSFNENLTFQDYIDCKSNQIKLDIDGFTISKTEIIYN